MASGRANSIYSGLWSHGFWMAWVRDLQGRWWLWVRRWVDFALGCNGPSRVIKKSPAGAGLDVLACVLLFGKHRVLQDAQTGNL